MTKTDTWMPLYVADYLKDTTHLSTIEHGAYFLLLLHAWTHDGLLPSDENRIARISGLSPKEWKHSGDVLLDFFTASEEGYKHKRVEQELVRAGNLVEQRRAAGKASAAAREAKRKGNERSTSVATKTQRNGHENPDLHNSHSTVEGSIEPPTGAEAPSVDPEKQFWDSAKSYLTAAGVKNPAPLIGKWRRDHSREEVLGAITRAQIERAAEPVSFIEGCFKPRRRGDPPDEPYMTAPC